MNLFDRFILTIYSLALIVISGYVIGVMVYLIPAEYVLSTLENLLYNTGVNIPYLAVAIIFLIISLRFFLSAFSFRRSREEKGIYQRNEYGVVNISLETIRAIAERTAKKVNGVKGLVTKVKSDQTRNTIILRVTTDGETSIPQMTQALQYEVKNQVEAITGVDIAEVTVVVSEVVTGHEQPVVRANRRLD
ncbi:alkaline shock response membrane anchor protein AmaP [Brevibacillus dissolubilis]|uniref:alkaline shock response membrane anchor protein AmaP n=1 Tax=Brevibacillus dissolubilis TaxID=1844116 RepID=UPI0011172F1A|nr:alkaline shock response membrane anchor protein AmaP [Brevibacillus dissolubilis]